MKIGSFFELALCWSTAALLACGGGEVAAEDAGVGDRSPSFCSYADGPLDSGVSSGRGELCSHGYVCTAPGDHFAPDGGWACCIKDQASLSCDVP